MKDGKEGTRANGQVGDAPTPRGERLRAPQVRLFAGRQSAMSPRAHRHRYAPVRYGRLGISVHVGTIPAHKKVHQLMNHQGVSEIVFEETCAVPSEQTAKSLFMRLPHGRDYASTLIECLATSYLLAMAESICIREMQRHIDADIQVIVGRSIRIEHLAPIPSGTTLRLRGWVEQVGRRSATFCVRARDSHEPVCECVMTLVAVQRSSIEACIATKARSIQGVEAVVNSAAS